MIAVYSGSETGRKPKTGSVEQKGQPQNKREVFSKASAREGEKNSRL
jgi:hypothetical protein